MSLKTITTALCWGVLGGLLSLAPVANADEWDKKTEVTFKEPVEVPGRVLAPGRYVFKLLDSESDRHIVQIFSADEAQLYATILAIPDYRMQPKGKTVLTFEERASGAPEAIHTWFYPGDEYGQEFVYPKARAVELAKTTQQPVLAMPAGMASHITKPAKSAQEAHVAEMKKAPVTAITPQQKEVEIAQVAKPAPAEQPPQPPAAETLPKRLPKTASDFPLVALFGLLSLGAGLALRIVSKRAA